MNRFLIVRLDISMDFLKLRILFSMILLIRGDFDYLFQRNLTQFITI